MSFGGLLIVIMFHVFIGNTVFKITLDYSIVFVYGYYAYYSLAIVSLFTDTMSVSPVDSKMIPYLYMTTGWMEVHQLTIIIWFHYITHDC